MTRPEKRGKSRGSRRRRRREELWREIQERCRGRKRNRGGGEDGPKLTHQDANDDRPGRRWFKSSTKMPMLTRPQERKGKMIKSHALNGPNRMVDSKCVAITPLSFSEPENVSC